MVEDSFVLSMFVLCLLHYNQTITLFFKYFELQENIPVISIMCNKGMRTRHWGQMSDQVGYDITPDSGTTLRKMLKRNLSAYMEQFENISGAATKVKLSL